MILVTISQDGQATVRNPQKIAQGTDSEAIILLSPFPVRCPVLMGWVMPDGAVLEAQDTVEGQNGNYYPMTNIVPPSDATAEGFDKVSVWMFKPSKAFTAKFGTALACFMVQLQENNGQYGRDGGSYVYKNLTTNPVEIEITETIVPAIPDNPTVSVWADLLAAITYYNEYLQDIDQNGVSTIYGTDNEPLRSVNLSDNLENDEDIPTAKAVKEAVEGMEHGEVTGVKGAAQAEYEKGDVNITPEKIGLGNVDNTSDENKPVSTLQREAIDEAERAAERYADDLAFHAGVTRIFVNTKNSENDHEAINLNLKYGNGFDQSDASPELTIEKVYENLTDIPNFNKYVSLNDVAEYMDKNSFVGGKTKLGVNSLGIPQYYDELIPLNAPGDGVIKIKKLNNRASFTYAETCNVEAVGNPTGENTMFNINSTLYGVSFVDKNDTRTLRVVAYKNGTAQVIPCPYDFGIYSNVCSAEHDGKIYIIDDYYNSLNDILQNRVIIFDSATLTFSLYATPQAGQVKNGKGAVYGGKVYIPIYGSSLTAPFLEYDISNNSLSVSSLTCQSPITVTKVTTNGSYLYVGTSDGKILYWDGVAPYLDLNELSINAISGMVVSGIAFYGTEVWVSAYRQNGTTVEAWIVSSEGRYAYDNLITDILVEGDYLYGYNGFDKVYQFDLSYSDPQPSDEFTVGRLKANDLCFYDGQVWFALTIDDGVSHVHTCERKPVIWVAEQYTIIDEDHLRASEWRKIEDEEGAEELFEKSTLNLAESLFEKGTNGLTFTFDTQKMTAVCTGGTVTGDIVIPSYVENGGKWYKVTSVDDSAFYQNTDITSVTFGKTIESVGEYAFSGCTQLASIAYNDYTLVSFGRECFYGCTLLNADHHGTGLTFYGNKTIGRSCFALSGVSSVKCFGDITFGIYAFSTCHSLASFISYGSVYFNHYPFLDCDALTTYKTYNYVHLGQYAFMNCSALRAVTITKDTEIEAWYQLFRGTSNLVVTIERDGQKLSAQEELAAQADATNITIQYGVFRKYLHCVSGAVTAKNELSKVINFRASFVTDDNAQLATVDDLIAAFNSAVLSFTGLVVDSSTPYFITNCAEGTDSFSVIYLNGTSSYTVTVENAGTTPSSVSQAFTDNVSVIAGY